MLKRKIKRFFVLNNSKKTKTETSGNIYKKKSTWKIEIILMHMYIIYVCIHYVY